MSMTLERVVTQLQQELFTMRAQVAAESRHADAVREETHCCRNEPGSEFSRTCKETCSRKFRHQRRGRLEVPHKWRISRAFVPHLEKVYSNLRQQLKRKPEDKMEDLDVNTLIWGMFVIVTQQAAVHLGNDCLDNLHPTKKQPQRTVKQLFDVRRKLVKEQKEIQAFSMINWQENSWKRTTLLTDQAVRLSTAKA